jgi:hypothetical protein
VFFVFFVVKKAIETPQILELSSRVEAMNDAYASI